jgi:hypothetical protein
MGLYTNLKKAKSEEDVKDAYIQALSLKSYTKGLIDIQTDEIWFEAKDNSKTSFYEMFTQLLHYVQVALNKGEKVPPLLAVIDTEKAALMKSSDVIPFLAKRTVKWGKSATKYTQEALDEISTHIGTYFVSYKISQDESEFISTVKAAIKTGEIIRTQITPDNLKQVFDKWVQMIGREINGVIEADYALLFFADIMNDGTVSTHDNLTARLLYDNGDPVFKLRGNIYELGNRDGYRKFWSIYHRPPKIEYRDYLLERRDSLIPLNERDFKGAYYTPLNLVDKSYDLLTFALGKNWQKNYIVWDMCCGVGNLEVKHSNHRNIFMSTLDVADVDVMKATKTCVSAHRFQYDYLNDDIGVGGVIDYSITNKLPIELQVAIKEGKKILIFINPPYAESGDTLGSDAKTDVATTKMASNMANYGFATRELFTQFVARISKEIPNATLAMFSKMKYVNAPNFQKFRDSWSAKFIAGFAVHSKAFDGLSGDFPIGFLIWELGTKAPFSEISVDVYDKKVVPIGTKTFYILPDKTSLNEWIKRPKPNSSLVIPLKNAILPAIKTKDVRGTFWSDGAIGQMLCDSNDLQHAGQRTAIFSSGYSSAGALYIRPDNLERVAVVFAVRRLIKPTWLNDRDQFSQPTKSLPTEFVNDCLIWMLFSGSNLSAGADNLEWNGKKWSITNHFIPFTEIEVGATDRFKSDFMSQHISKILLSDLSKEVMSEGCILWRKYFSQIDVRSIRDEYKLNRPDVGWYQIRHALKSRNKTGDSAAIDFSPFEKAYKSLTDKLIPQVYEYGFLR